jgi:hypothetical protein
MRTHDRLNSFVSVFSLASSHGKPPCARRVPGTVQVRFRLQVGTGGNPTEDARGIAGAWVV